MWKKNLKIRYKITFVDFDIYFVVHIIYLFPILFPIHFFSFFRSFFHSNSGTTSYLTLWAGEHLSKAATASETWSFAVCSEGIAFLRDSFILHNHDSYPFQIMTSKWSLLFLLIMIASTFSHSLSSSLKNWKQLHHQYHLYSLLPRPHLSFSF